MKKVHLNFVLFSLLLTGLTIVFVNKIFKNKSDFFVEKNSVYLKFDGKFIELSPNRTNLQLDYSILSWMDFDKLELYQLESSKSPNFKPNQIEIYAQGYNGSAKFTTNETNTALWRKITEVCGDDASLYLKIHTTDKKQFFAAIKSDIDAPNYLSGLMNSRFLGNSTFQIRTTPDQMPQQEGYQIHTFSPNEAITPHFLFNEDLRQGQNVFLDEVSSSNDSLHALVKTESGTVYKHCFEDDEAFDLSKILEQHVEASTIYICKGDPASPDRRLSILNISNDNTLQAIQSDLLLKTVGINLDQIRAPYIAYKNEDLNFVWGDIHFAFTKNKAGDFFAKKRIGRSQWNSAISKTPSLILGKSLFMDSLSFDFSIASNDVDTVNKVLLRDVSTEDVGDSIQKILPDSIVNFPDDSQESIIRLDSIKNEQTGQANISLEIEVFDDTPKVKQRKFQFHWGDIDTTLVQQNKNGDFTQSVELSLAKFQTILKKEPVLTSSKSGVVDSFNCKVSHYREDQLIGSIAVACNLKNARVFANTLKELEVLDTALRGDKIILHSFTSSQIKNDESLSIEIKLLKNTLEDEAISVDDQNLFLQWGDLKLKATTLGDSSPKKRNQDQVIEKDKLQEIIREQTFLNKYGMKESVVNAEWFLNDNIFKTNDCKNENWRECFTKQINRSKSGDFVSLFLRTTNGAGVMCQFYIDHVKSDALIGYGNTQFDSLLFKYSKYVVSKITLPKYKYEFSWGKSKIPLELVGNPRVYGGKVSINIDDLKEILRDKIDINSSDGEVISINHAYLILHKVRSEKRPKKFYSYDFDCENNDCAFTNEEVLRVLDDLEGQVFSVGVFVDQHVPTEEGIKVSYIDFIIEDDSNAWVPEKWISSKYPTDLFEFQFVYQNKEKTLIKFDQENEKYKWIYNKYKNDTSVELIDMPGFKTTQRAIYTKYDYGHDENIRNTQVLTRNYTNGFTLYEYHDLAEKKINFYWKGYPSLYGAQSYCKDDFICAEGELELTIDSQKIDILRGDLVILPEHGTGYKFVFDDIESEEIAEVVADLPPYTSLLFENILVEGDDGEPLRLPMKFSYHLE